MNFNFITKDNNKEAQDYKHPLFKVSTFYDDTLTGDSLMEVMRMEFHSNAMARYLESSRYYDNNPYRSGAFASSIREFISWNDILSFLPIELETEQNFCKFWLRAPDHLTTSYTTTARVMSQ